jgi:hypothetical protein
MARVNRANDANAEAVFVGDSAAIHLSVGLARLHLPYRLDPYGTIGRPVQVHSFVSQGFTYSDQKRQNPRT